MSREKKFLNYLMIIPEFYLKLNIKENMEKENINS